MLNESVIKHGCDHPSIGHSPNSYEYVMVTEGKIAITVNETEYALGTGDALYFDASVPHRYVNVGTETAKMTLLIQYL